MDLQLVQHTGLERPLRRTRHAPARSGRRRRPLRVPLRSRSIGRVRHQRIVRDGLVGRPVAGNEDRDTVMITPRQMGQVDEEARIRKYCVTPAIRRSTKRT